MPKLCNENEVKDKGNMTDESFRSYKAICIYTHLFLIQNILDICAFTCTSTANTSNQ